MKTQTKAANGRPLEAAVPSWLVDSIAKELWALNAKGPSLDWGGVEIHLGRIVKQARSEVRDSQAIRAAGRRARRALAAMEGARS